MQATFAETCNMQAAYARCFVAFASSVPIQGPQLQALHMLDELLTTV